jgi:hypothetical protein
MLKPVITDRIQDHCIIPVSLSISSFSTPKMYRRFRVLRRRIPPTKHHHGRIHAEQESIWRSRPDSGANDKILRGDLV